MKKIFTITALISILFVFLFGFLANFHITKIGGDAISGYVKSGKYYISLGEDEYKEVTQMIWIVNFSLVVLILISGAIFAISSFLGIIIYTVIPKWKQILGF